MNSKTKETAFAILNRRDHSVKELTDKLVEKGIAQEEAEECCRWLQELHILDDERYAALVVRHSAGKGYGINRVRQELHRRGVPRQFWDEALTEMEPYGETLERLVSAKLKPGADKKELTRTANSLIRRGFPSSQVWAVLREHSAGLDEDYPVELDD